METIDEATPYLIFQMWPRFREGQNIPHASIHFF